MGESAHRASMDRVQRALAPCLIDAGFKARGRTFNRRTSDGLVQVLRLWMGPFDPPGTEEVPGLRESLYGRFMVELGVYVPEVDAFYNGGTPAFVQDYHCCIRSRLARRGKTEKERWWPLTGEEFVVNEVRERIRKDGLRFLERFRSRDSILREWPKHGVGMEEAARPSRIVAAFIRAGRGEKAIARRLLEEQARSEIPGHAEHVQELATHLGLGELGVTGGATNSDS